ncbi:MAG: hypothetical protein R2799_03395 [Crocinitomicaceae bacterium]
MISRNFITLVFVLLTVLAQAQTNKETNIKMQDLDQPFFLSLKENRTIENTDSLSIQFTGCVKEWGYDAPPEDPNRKYFEEVQYTLEMKHIGFTNTVSFTSSNIQENLYFLFHEFKIYILSEVYNDQNPKLELKVEELK